jgi:UDP-N-acetylmuramoyl-tripeptide--D-alanyl-D-alanine ligase
MEFFGNLNAVAEEELTVFKFSRRVLVNVDDTDATYLAGRNYRSYGASTGSEFTAKRSGKATAAGQKLNLTLEGKKLTVTTPYLGEQGAKIVLAAAAVARLQGMETKAIAKALKAVEPAPGRLQQLAGVKNSRLFDDTYNASPLATKAALDVLYETDAPQRIAILGSMNELGVTSKNAHQEVGAYCDPKKLKLVVTIGADARKYLAPAAKKAGCEVKSFTGPYEAGDFVKKQLKSKAVVLAKGSQNGVFAEEALKTLLADPADGAKLVRQSGYWLAVKRAQFGDSKPS